MKKKIIGIFCILISVTGLCSAKNLVNKKNDEVDMKEHDGYTRISSFNIDFLQYGLKRPGWGMSVDFEQYLGYHMALSAVLGHSSFFGSWLDLSDFVTTASLGGNLIVYPFRNSLRGPYCGLGSGCDAMFYFGDRELNNDIQQYFWYLDPKIGWKIYIINHFMIDVHVDYKWQLVVRPDLPEFYKDYLDSGFHFGAGFKFFWGK